MKNKSKEYKISQELRKIAYMLCMVAVIFLADIAVVNATSEDDGAAAERILDNQIDYSTVYITISEVERITPVGEKGFFEEIADRFSASLYNVGRGFRGFFIVLIGSLPVLVVWAAVIAAVVLVVRKLFYGKKAEGETEKKSGWRKKKPEDNQ